MPNFQFSSRTFLLGACILMFVILIIRFVSSRIHESKRIRALETETFSPRNTFTGTMRHIAGLPLPSGISIAVACNKDVGIAFAKGRFRQTVPKDLILRAAFADERALKASDALVFPKKKYLHLPWSACMVIVRRDGGRQTSIVLETKWTARFAKRCIAALGKPADEGA